ncbi:hypothetical protein JCM13664_08340 [Methylothermus subterraneus]
MGKWLALVSLLLLTVAGLAADRRIAQLDFRSITVGDALRILTEESGLNVVASEKAARIPITMYLRNVAPLDVLEAMAKTYNLWYRRDPDSGIVRVYTVDEFRLGQVEYTREQIKVFTLKHEMNVLDAVTAITGLYGKRVIFDRNSQQDFQILFDLAQRFARFNIIDAQSRLGQGIGIGGGRFGGFGGRGFGGFGGFGGGGFGGFGGGFGFGFPGGFGPGLGQPQAGGETQVKPEEMREEMAGTERLTGELKEKEVVTEATRRLAPIYLTYIRRQNRLIVRTRDTDALEQIQELIARIDTDMATLLLEVKMFQIDLSDGYDSVFEFAIKDNKVGVSKGNVAFATTPDKVITQGVRENPDGTAETVDVATKLGPAILNSLATTAPSLGNPALLATLVTENFRARLQLMEKEGRVTQVATPMLFTSNQEVSRIFIGEERPITTDINVTCTTTTAQVITTTAGVCQFDPQVETRNIGDTLLLTPTINADGSVSIRLVVEQALPCPNCGRIPVPRAQTAAQFGQEVVPVDTVQTRTYTGSVIAQDGQEVAIGGLINESAEDREEKVPVLGDIPLLGRLFRDEVQRRKRTELVIVIRPFVIRAPQESQAVSERELREQSVHPGLDQRNRNLNVYKNPYGTHRGYELQEPYKTYPGQDAFDRYNRKDGYWRPPAREERELLPDATERLYLELTRYAAQVVHGESPSDRDLKIKALPAPPSRPVFLTPHLEATPLASWQRGGITVTALRLVNRSRKEVTFVAQDLKGEWLAATVEKPQLAPDEETYLYLLSAGSFKEALGR